MQSSVVLPRRRAGAGHRGADAGAGGRGSHAAGRVRGEPGHAAAVPPPSCCPRRAAARRSRGRRDGRRPRARPAAATQHLGCRRRRGRRSWSWGWTRRAAARRGASGRGWRAGRQSCSRSWARHVQVPRHHRDAPGVHWTTMKILAGCMIWSKPWSKTCRISQRLASSEQQSKNAGPATWRTQPWRGDAARCLAAAGREGSRRQGAHREHQGRRPRVHRPAPGQGAVEQRARGHDSAGWRPGGRVLAISSGGEQGGGAGPRSTASPGTTAAMCCLRGALQARWRGVVLS